MKITHLILASALLASSGTLLAAEDCGEPPVDIPTIPNGAVASADQIRTARDAVVGFSRVVDEYLACMDERGQVLMPYLTKEQRQRWENDLADLHDKRRDLQTEMNTAIRTYRAAHEGN